jgi:hypothetical protein
MADADNGTAETLGLQAKTGFQPRYNVFVTADNTHKQSFIQKPGASDDAMEATGDSA